jgi:hypothetical protein
MVASRSPLMHRSGADAAVLAADAGILARFDRWKHLPFRPPNRFRRAPVFTESMPLRGGLVIQFDITTTSPREVRCVEGYRRTGFRRGAKRLSRDRRHGGAKILIYGTRV